MQLIAKMKGEFFSEDDVTKIKNNFIKQNNGFDILRLQKMVSNLIYKNLLEKTTNLELSSDFEELITFENLKKYNPSAFEILKYCSLINRYYLTADVLKALVEKDLDKSLEILNKIYLIQIYDNKIFIDKSIQEDFLRFIKFQEYNNTEYLQLLVKILKKFMSKTNSKKNTKHLQLLVKIFKKIMSKTNSKNLEILNENSKYYLHQITIFKRIDFMKIKNNIGNDQERRKLYEEIEPLRQKIMFIDSELRFIG